MVSLDAVRASNARVKTDLPSGLVAVFVGATSGIGEAALKAFAEHASKPRIYFTGRSQDSGPRLEKELRQLNADGEYVFLRNDSSLLRNVDSACRDIRAREESINLLCITMGTLVTGKVTAEGIPYMNALTYYCRMRFAMNLLPLMRKASALRRVMTVFAGTKEGPIFADDFQGSNIPMTKARGHMVSMITLAFEHLSRQAPEVSFVHDYPGFVKTGLANEMDKGVLLTIGLGIFNIVSDLFLNTPIDEVGERQLFIATSAMYPARTGDADGVALGQGLTVATNTEGKTGGAYSVDNNNEPAGENVLDVLARMRDEGIADRSWEHLAGELRRVTGSLSS